jgi:hypothetical protein
MRLVYASHASLSASLRAKSTGGIWWSSDMIALNTRDGKPLGFGGGKAAMHCASWMWIKTGLS